MDPMPQNLGPLAPRCLRICFVFLFLFFFHFPMLDLTAIDPPCVPAAAVVPTSSVRVSDLRIDALVYSVHERFVDALWIAGGERRQVRLGSTAELAAEADGVRGELRDTIDVSMGRVPLLERFVTEWGRELVPSELLDAPPDVLVIVPHAFLHDMPLQLALTSTGAPPATTCGVTFASSMSLFTGCVERNPARRLDLASWRFEEDGGPRCHPHRWTSRHLLGAVDRRHRGEDP
jgi:hypothetical protein